MELMQWVSSEFPDRPIYVREHPQRPVSKSERRIFSKFPNLRLMPEKDYSLIDLFKSSSISVIEMYSSAIMESIGADTLPVIFNDNKSFSYKPDVTTVGIEVKTLETAKEVIFRLLTDELYLQQFEPAMRKFQEKFFNKGKQNSLSRIVDEIVSLC